MKIVGFLDQKKVTRTFGLLLILAQFSNLIFSAYLRSGKQQIFLSSDLLWSSFGASPFFDKILLAASLIVGSLLIAGSMKSWHFVMLLLGLHVGSQIINLGPNLRMSWIYGVVFLVNVALFLFIGDQLVFRQKVIETKTAMPISSTVATTVTSVTVKAEMNEARKSQYSKKRIIIHFAGIGPWARLTGITTKGLYLKSIAPPPQNLANRPVEIQFEKNLKLSTCLKKQTDQEYFFEFTDLRLDQVNDLNRWIVSKAA